MQAILGTQYIGKPEGSNFGSFFMMIQESLMNSARRVYIQTDDLDRTVGINTDYIKMDDFSLDREDQEFLIQQGYKATAAFLRYYIHQHYEKPGCKSSGASSQENSDLSSDGEESDYSPCHDTSTPGSITPGSATPGSCSGADTSDIEADITTSSSSRSTKSPGKSDTVGNGRNEYEEVIVAEVELPPDDKCYNQQEQVHCQCDHDQMLSDCDEEEITPRPTNHRESNTSSPRDGSKTTSDVNLKAIQSLTVEDSKDSPKTHRRSRSSPLCHGYSDAIEVIHSYE